MVELENKKIIIYGAGRAGRRINGLLPQKAYAFCDTYKTGVDKVTKLNILSNTELLEHKDAYIIIGISDYNNVNIVCEVEVFLRENGFKETAILRYSEFLKLASQCIPMQDWQNDRDHKYCFGENFPVIAHMAKWIDSDDESVVDLGAGDMCLRSLLPSSVSYYPVDYIQRMPETIVIDLNKNITDLKIHADVYFLCAMLYYMDNPAGLLEHISRYAEKKIIIALHKVNFGRHPEVMHVGGYKSYMYVDEITRLLTGQGFSLKRNEVLEEKHRVCLLYKRSELDMGESK